MPVMTSCPTCGQAMREQALEQAVQMYLDGDLIQHIKTATGIDTRTLYTELDRQQIPLRRAGETPRGSRATQRAVAAERRWNRGWTRP